jgi:predicted secreted Zn-dependent protease
MNKIPLASKLVDDVSIEFYTSSLSMSMTMFVKRDKNTTLEATLKETIEIEKEVISLEGNFRAESSKDKVNTKMKTSMTKHFEDNKEFDSTYMESL